MLRRFNLEEPESLKEASLLLSKYGERGRILAGGTELLLAMKQGMLRYDYLINIKRIPGLDRIDYDERNGKLRIGALVTHRTLEKSELIKERFPLIVEMERQIANIRVRNQGTIGGNLCWADPRSDVIILLVALGARLRAVGLEGERVIPLEDFLAGYYETVLKGDEVLREIEIPEMSPDSRGAYLRFTRGERPIVGVALVLKFDQAMEGVRDAVLSLGCDHPPFRAKEAEEYLKGKAVGEVLARLKEAGERATKDLNLRDDPHASRWYKLEMVRVMVQNVIREACHKRDKI